MTTPGSFEGHTSAARGATSIRRPRSFPRRLVVVLMLLLLAACGTTVPQSSTGLRGNDQRDLGSSGPGAGGLNDAARGAEFGTGEGNPAGEAMGAGATATGAGTGRSGSISGSSSSAPDA